MNIDIRTLAIFLTGTCAILSAALFLQYLLNKNNQNGMGWWTVGMTLTTLGVMFDLLRDNPAYWGISILVNNALFISSLVVFHSGFLRFFGQKENRLALTAFSIIVSLIVVYFTFIDDNLLMRQINIYSTSALLSFLIARSIFKYSTKAVKASAHFLALTFIINGVFFCLRALPPFFAELLGTFFSAALTQIATYIHLLGASLLWTYGFIMLVNQRLNADHQESQDNLELIFNTIPDAVMITNLANGKLVRVNDGFSEITGYTRAEALETNAFENTLWVTPADHDDLIKELETNGSRKKREAFFRRKDGSQLFGMISARIITIYGQPHLLSITHDITHRKQIENELRDSAEKYEIMFQDSPDAFLIINEGIFVECNRTSEALLGGTHEQIIGQSPETLSPEYQPDGKKSSEAAQEHMKIANQTGMHTFEWIHRRFDGSDIFVEVSIAPIITNGKQSLFTTWRDITARKRIEKTMQENEQRYRSVAENNTDIVWYLGLEIAERERAQKELKISENRYRLLAENTSDVVWVIEPGTSNILYISPSVEQLLGYTSDELLSLPFTVCLTTESREFFMPMLKQQVANFVSQPVNNSGIRVELVYIKKDQAKIWVETMTHFYLNPITNQVEIQGMSRDITERKRFQDELQQQATTDELTKTFNRRHFLSLANIEHKRSARLKCPITIAIIDLDHFKDINDTYGHAFGDLTLKLFSTTCLETVREIDVFARFGGDEFALLLPDTEINLAYHVLKRIHYSVTHKPFDVYGIQIPITISAGIASSTDGIENLDDLIIRADQCLYKAKEAGRNQIWTQQTSLALNNANNPE